MSNALLDSFDERWQEIREYLDLLDVVERELQSGVPKIGNSATITSTQQKILYSSLYLQLYNLVESTVTQCIELVCEASAEGGQWRPHDLTETLRREWVRHMARTHIDLNFENRLDDAYRLCQRIINWLPIVTFEISKGGGGNWDDVEIESFAEKRIGLKLIFQPATRTSAKRHIRNDQGALSLIKNLRNDLAHGSISFAECGANATVTELRDIANWTSNYLRELIHQFSDFVRHHQFLVPTSRPTS